MHIFVTGASGYVGRRVVRRLRDAGHRVTGLTRSVDHARELGVQGVDPVVGDLRDASLLADLARRAEATIHLAFDHRSEWNEAISTDRLACSSLVDALAGSGKRLVAASGASVLGDTGRRGVGEDHPVPDTPLSRRLAEQHVLGGSDRQVGVAVARLPVLVYGDGGSVLVPMLIDAARRAGWSGRIGSGDNRMSVLHVEDAADLFVRLLSSSRPRAVYHAGCAQSVSLGELAGAVGHLLGVPCREIMPQEALGVWPARWVALLRAWSLIDGSLAEAELGWRARRTGSLLHDIEEGSYAACRGLRSPRPCLPRAAGTGGADD